MNYKILGFFVFILLLTTTIIIVTTAKNKHLSKESETKINSQKPNLILISIDTLRADHVGVYGYSKPTTPNIDSLAKDAQVFSRFYTITPVTNHSFYSFFTGADDIFSYEDLGIKASDFINDAPSRTLLPEILQKNSYKTAAFVTNPMFGIVYKKFFSRGFNTWEYGNNLSQNDFNFEIYRNEYTNSKFITKKVLSFLENNRQSPFFLWVHFNGPHLPYNPPLKDLCTVTDKCSKSEYKEILKDTSINMFKTLLSCQNQTSLETIQKSETLCDGEIRATDGLVGEILKKLKKQNLYDNSVIIFLADHGEGFDHDIFGHSLSLYESAMHIPLIIKSKQNLSYSSSKLADNTDLLPTILDLLNIPYNEPDFTGRSLVKTDFKKDAVFGITPTNEADRFSLFDGTHRYILTRDTTCLYKNRTNELYNVSKDPLEEQNLVGLYPDIKKSFEQKLLQKISQRIPSKKNVTENAKKNSLIDQLRSIGY